MPSIAKEAVIGPVRHPGADAGNRHIIDDKHDDDKDWQRQPAVGHDGVDFIGNRHPGLIFLRIALTNDRTDIIIPFIGDDAFRIVVQLVFRFLNQRSDIRNGVHHRRDLIIALKQLDRVEPLHFRRNFCR